MEKFRNSLGKGVRESFSDIHIVGGHPLVYRKNGTILYDNKISWSHDEVDQLVNSLLTPRELRILKERLSVDTATTIHNMRIRIHVFNSTRGASLSIRLLPGKPPNLTDLNLHPSLRDYCLREAGLILICGNTGSGKSSTIAGMIEEINKSRTAHIVTLEDPIEYRFKSKQAFIEQRELGNHFRTFEQGLVDVLREDPDVIVVGELRDLETIRLTLNAAEAGHLVIATLHGTNSEDAIRRMTNSFPPEAQDIVRAKIASTLSLLIVQSLVIRPGMTFRIPRISILTGTTQIKGLVRDDRLNQLESVLQTSRNRGMFTMDQYEEEYLSKVTYFNPPDLVFKPSEEVSTEIIYRSPVFQELDDEKPAAKAAPVIRQELEPEPVRRKVDYHFTTREDAPVRSLVIEEEISMDKVLTEIHDWSRKKISQKH